MPMNEEVREAAETIDSFFANRARGLTMAADINMYDWIAIRDELTRLTEIADSVDPLVVRLGEVTTQLEAANALLRNESALLRAWARESREGGWSTHQVDPMKRRADEIDAHLSEPRT